MKFTSEKDFREVSNENTVKLILEEELEFNWHLKERLEERKMSGRKLSRITGIHPNVVADYVNNNMKSSSVNMEHVFAMMIALRISNSEELFSISMPHSTKIRFARERNKWIADKKLPDHLKEIERKNKG